MRDRTRWLRIASVLGGLGLAILAVAALLHWGVPNRLIQNSTETWRWVERASWVAAVGSLLMAIIASWQVGRATQDKHAEHVDPHRAREAEARDRLRAVLGRRDALPRMGDPSTPALALRVHPAIPLPSPDPDPGGGSRAAQPAGTAFVFQRWRSWFQRAGPQGKHDRRLDSDLPRFVDREKSSELRDWLRAATETGGFLIVVGNSSVGKTRLLYELAREVLPDFAVLAPDLGRRPGEQDRPGHFPATEPDRLARRGAAVP